ncbi:MAG: TIGR03086 family metal-binding protein [Mycobacterium sp.]|uniref:TIGR03086 family metal-binding protein n=1 Tax=Mycobacterium sp. TaxID=1785 RepID=UPI003BB5903C
MSDIGPMATEAMGFLVEAVEQIAPENWYRPSNLEGWGIPDLVAHVTGSAAKIVALVEGVDGQEPSQPDVEEYADRATRLRELAGELQDALADADLDATRPSPQGDVPLQQALRFPIFGLSVHAWDVYRSQARPVELPADLLAFCREVVDSVPEDELRRPGVFGAARAASEDATPTDCLMAFVGRSVD